MLKLGNTVWASLIPSLISTIKTLDLHFSFAQLLLTFQAHYIVVSVLALDVSWITFFIVQSFGF